MYLNSYSYIPLLLFCVPLLLLFRIPFVLHGLAISSTILTTTSIGKSPDVVFFSFVAFEAACGIFFPTYEYE